MSEEERALRQKVNQPALAAVLNKFMFMEMTELQEFVNSKAGTAWEQMFARYVLVNIQKPKANEINGILLDRTIGPVIRKLNLTNDDESIAGLFEKAAKFNKENGEPGPTEGGA